MSTSLRLCTLVSALSLLVVACASTRVADTASRVAPQAAAIDERVVARSEQLRRGERAVVLPITGIGRLVARCDRRGRAAVSFVADPLLATASVAVQTNGHRSMRTTLDPGERVNAPRPTTGDGVQTWQVAEFAKVERVTTIWVSLGRSPGAPFYACGVSAHALTTGEQP